MSTLCLLDGIARDQISQAFPAVFHTGSDEISDEILAVGTAWEQGYVSVSVFLCMIVCVEV